MQVVSGLFPLFDRNHPRAAKFPAQAGFSTPKVPLCEIIETSNAKNYALNKPQSTPPASKNNLILSGQGERFNFSPQATHPVSNIIVHYAWIDQRGPTVVQVVSGLFPLFDNNESSESGESIFRSIRSIRRCLIING